MDGVFHFDVFVCTALNRSLIACFVVSIFKVKETYPYNMNITLVKVLLTVDTRTHFINLEQNILRQSVQ